MQLSVHNRAVLQMAVCAIMWSIGGIFIKMIPWNPFVIAGMRGAVGGVVIWCYMRIKRITFHWNKSVVLAALMLSLTCLAFVTANKLTTAANAIVLQFTAPVFIMVISFFGFGQRFRRVDYLVVALTLLGISLCFLDQLSPGNILGNIIGVCSGFFFGMMFLFNGRAGFEERMSAIFLAQVFTAAVGIVTCFFAPPAVTSTAVVNILILGIIQLGLPYILYADAARHCSPLVCSLIGALEPLLNPVWVFLFDGERPGTLALLGSAVVILTVTLWCVWDARQAAMQSQVSAASPAELS